MKDNHAILKGLNSGSKKTKRARMWGSGTFRRWAPFDPEREAGEKALIIGRRSGLIKEITITLDTEDPDKAYELLYDLLHQNSALSV